METRKVIRLAEIMGQYGLTELEIKDKDTSVRLCRGGVPVAMPVATLPVATNGECAAEAEAAEAPQAVSKPVLTVRAPMPGTFYSSSSPEAPAYVTEGDVVTPDTVVCIVEAMKVMNEVKAEVSGVITKVLAANGAPVEYGQSLFEVTPGGMD